MRLNAKLTNQRDEMRAALEAVETWWLTDMMLDGAAEPACIFMARAALAKARGESLDGSRQ
jgi:hypothetical protein